LALIGSARWAASITTPAVIYANDNAPRMTRTPVTYAGLAHLL